MSGVAGCLSKEEKCELDVSVCVTEKCPVTAAGVCQCVQAGGVCIFRVGVSKEVCGGCTLPAYRVACV